MLQIMSSRPRAQAGTMAVIQANGKVASPFILPTKQLNRMKWLTINRANY
jgi:hypothetical protein